MDPNECLRQLRKLVVDNIDREFVSDHVVDEVLERIGALDEWLSRGGSLPLDWHR